MWGDERVARRRPGAEVAHGQTGCMVSLNDLADRQPRALADGEVIDLGGKRVRYLDTPHVPHGWEAGLLYEETTGRCSAAISSHMSARACRSPPAIWSDHRSPLKRCSTLRACRLSWLPLSDASPHSAQRHLR